MRFDNRYRHKDDEPSVRMLVADMLEQLGYRAIAASDGASGLKLLQSEARIARPDLKVLFITGSAENAVVGNGTLAPGMHVMTKPFAMEALAKRIRTLIDRG